MPVFWFESVGALLLSGTFHTFLPQATSLSPFTPWEDSTRGSSLQLQTSVAVTRDRCGCQLGSRGPVTSPFCTCFSSVEWAYVAGETEGVAPALHLLATEVVTEKSVRAQPAPSSALPWGPCPVISGAQMPGALLPSWCHSPGSSTNASLISQITEMPQAGRGPCRSR